MSMIRELNAIQTLPRIEAAPTLVIAPAPDCDRFSLRLKPDGIGAAGEAIGLALPPRIGGYAEGEGISAACLGPDEWYLWAPAGTGGEIARRLSAGVATPHSLVDIGHRDVGIDITGADASLALSTVCALDLDAMASPFAVRTLLDRVQAVIVRHGPERYRIEVWQSYADHLWGLLGRARDEIALKI